MEKEEEEENRMRFNLKIKIFFSRLRKTWEVEKGVLRKNTFSHTPCERFNSFSRLRWEKPENNNTKKTRSYITMLLEYEENKVVKK